MTEGNFGLGMACCAVSAVGFGSNYLPVKRVDCGDGVFFALCMAVGIGFVGLVLNYSEMTTGAYFEGPQFRPIAMLGGTAWMLGNLLTPRVIKLIGLGVGLSVWDLSNMCMGWATGYFGLFGVWREPAQTPWLNFVGMGLAGVSLLVLAQAIEEPEAMEKPDIKGGKSCAGAAPDSDGEVSQHDVEAQGRGAGGDDSRREEAECAGSPPLSPSSLRSSGASPRQSAGVKFARSVRGDSECHPSAPASSGSSATRTPSAATPAVSTSESVACSSPGTPRGEGKASRPPRSRCSWLVGLSMAILAGVLFGLTFDSSTVLMQRAILGDTRFSANNLDYVLSNYVGIVVTGACCFLIYLCVMRKSAFVSTEVILPGIASGAMWAVAQAAWFKANQELSMVLAFPLISSLPGMVALFWGVCFFGELRSRRSRQFAAVAVALRIPSVVCIAISGIA